MYREHQLTGRRPDQVCAHVAEVPPLLSTLLRDARLRAGMSRVTLARHAGLSVSTIKNLERGRPASLPTVRSLLSVRELELPDDLRHPFAQDPRVRRPSRVGLASSVGKAGD